MRTNFVSSIPNPAVFPLPNPAQEKAIAEARKILETVRSLLADAVFDIVKRDLASLPFPRKREEMTDRTMALIGAASIAEGLLNDDLVTNRLADLAGWLEQLRTSLAAFDFIEAERYVHNAVTLVRRARVVITTWGWDAVA